MSKKVSSVWKKHDELCESESVQGKDTLCWCEERFDAIQQMYLFTQSVKKANEKTNKLTSKMRFKVAEFLADFHGEVNDSQVGSAEDYLMEADKLLQSLLSLQKNGC